MPAILTHNFFGADALGAASSVLGFAAFDENDAFLLGNQGPDPLFYLVADPTVDASVRDLGDQMHHDRPRRLILALHDAISMLPEEERTVGEAYAAGFLCHYLLDSRMHPLVFSWEYGICDAGVPGLDRSDGGKVHAEIERDLDEMVLFTKTGETVSSWAPWRHVLQASDQTLATIDKLYFYLALWTYSRTVPQDLYTKAVKSFRRIQHLFWSPGGGKTAVLAPVERLFTHNRYSLYSAMAHRPRAEKTSDFDNRDHRPWADPFTGAVRTEGFWDLYEGALGSVLAAERAFFDPDFDLGRARELTEDKNFSGEVVPDVDPAHQQDPDGQEPQAPRPPQEGGVS